MPIPAPVLYPPFNITRVSHAAHTVRDLERTREFYCEVFGLVVSHQDMDMLYLRGVDEVCHHSLVFRRSDEPPRCERVGLRVLSEAELDKAYEYFAGIGLAPAWAEVPYQGRSLRVTDPMGIPLEFCARMQRMERIYDRPDLQRGSSALRLDHVQLHVTDVQAALDFYFRLGFRCGDYMTAGEHDETIFCAFTYRKDNPADLVFMSGQGPRFHHCGYITPSFQDLFRACDIAGVRGLGNQIERGPGRHSVAHAHYVYMRDPDGHRVELLLDVWHQMLDLEIEPVRWRLFGQHTAGVWGLPAQAAWFYQATEFAGVTPQPVRHSHQMHTLEKYLAARHAENR
jgi:catechol 2,3-dioxygenase